MSAASVSVTEAAGSGKKIRIGGVGLLVPILAFLFVFFIIPMTFMLSLSFDDGSGSYSLANFAEILNDGPVASVILNTLKTAAWATIITVVLSYPVAYYLAMAPAGSTGLIMIVVLLPFWTSVLVRAFAWMLLLGRNGVINSTLMNAGLIEQPLEMLYTFFSVTISMVHALMPVAVLTMLSAMQNYNRSLSLAAATLGSESGNTFWRIFFPISFPASRPPRL